MQGRRLFGAWRAAGRAEQERIASAPRGSAPGGLPFAVAVEPVREFTVPLGREAAASTLFVQKSRAGGETGAWKVGGRGLARAAGWGAGGCSVVGLRRVPPKHPV